MICQSEFNLDQIENHMLSSTSCWMNPDVGAGLPASTCPHDNHALGNVEQRIRETLGSWLFRISRTVGLNWGWAELPQPRKEINVDNLLPLYFQDACYRSWAFPNKLRRTWIGEDGGLFQRLHCAFKFLIWNKEEQSTSFDCKNSMIHCYSPSCWDSPVTP